jgi:hypothetical protein
MFICHTGRHPERRKDHLGQNILRLQASQERKGTRPAHRGRRQTSTADIKTFKILINSTHSTEDAAMMMMDTKNYYLGTPLPRFEYMTMLLSCFPEEIIQKYNLNDLAVDGWVYIEIRKVCTV